MSAYTDTEFQAQIARWAAKPDVRRMMATLRGIYDDYAEEPTDFQWLVVDAAAIVDHIHDDDHLELDQRIFAGLIDSARVDADETIDQHRAVIATIRGSLTATANAA